MYLSQLAKNSYILNWDRYGLGRWKKVRQVDCVMGSFMFIRASAIGDSELFDKDYFMYGEETDFCYRMKKAGFKTLFFPQAKIVHVHGGSQPNPDGIAWAYGAKSRAILRFLHKWRPGYIAYIANAIMLSGLIIKTAAWFCMDIIRGLINNRRFRKTSLLKAGILPFHLKGLLKPSIFDEKWGKP